MVDSLSSSGIARRLTRRRMLSQVGTGAVAAVAALAGYGRDTSAAPACTLCRTASTTCLDRCYANGYYLYYWDEGCYRCFECFTTNTGTCWTCSTIYCSAIYGICA